MREVEIRFLEVPNFYWLDPVVKVEVAIGRRRTWYGKRAPGRHALVRLAAVIPRRGWPGQIEGIVDWTRPAIETERAVRALNPWPGASTVWKGRHLKLWRASALVEPVAAGLPGVVLARAGDVLVTTGDGILRLELVQLAGKAVMPAADFVRGHPAFLHAQLGAE